MVAVADRDVVQPAPTLVGVIDELRARPRERNPPELLGLGELEDDADASAAGAALDAPRDVVAGPLGLQGLDELIGLGGVEPSPDQRLEAVAQRSADLLLREAFDLDALDRVAGIDVRAEAGIVADPGDEEDDAGLIAGPRHDPDRHHDLRTFFLDPAGELRDVRTGERSSRELVDVAPEPGTELVAGDTGDLRRLDAHAVQWFVVLRDC